MISREAYIAMVGKEVGVSEWHLVDQARIDAFATATEDHQFIHVDPARARETPFGTTIAHGFLTMSLLSVFSYEALPKLADVAMGVNYGTDKIRFLSPVKAGARLRGRFVLTEATLRKPNELFTRTSATVEIDGEDKPALVADWLGLVYFN
ncbi:MaoC family dehydratase [Tardiphaga sp.]|jgi:acyl dehydratase|uniref:MaoC family dehydratase n=1 Tax=Tardiphaga sp. TaxID=1926292 RepID=UPI0037D9A254